MSKQIYAMVKRLVPVLNEVQDTIKPLLKTVQFYADMSGAELKEEMIVL